MAGRPALCHMEAKMPLSAVLLVLLILLAFGVAPHWSYSRGWGYAPSGVLGFLVLVLVILILIGRVP